MISRFSRLISGLFGAVIIRNDEPGCQGQQHGDGGCHGDAAFVFFQRIQPGFAVQLFWEMMPSSASLVSTSKSACLLP